MDTFGIILGVLIVINIILAIVNKNISAIFGWVVCLMEWTRRFNG